MKKETYSVEIRVPMQEKDLAKGAKALESETDFKGKAGISMESSKDKKTLIISIKSKDLPSLHAATGSILRAVKIMKAVENEGEESSDETEE